MPLRLCRLCLLVATVAATAWAQTTPPAPAVTTPPAPTIQAPRIPTTRSTVKTAKPGKTGVPDPDLLDGSAFEKEKRPLEGMLSEIEMGEKEGPKGAKVSPDSGPGGSQQQSPDKSDPTKTAGGGAETPPQNSEQQAGGASADAQQQAAGGAQAEQAQSSQQQGGGSPAAEGPAAQAQGTQVANLKVPEGAQNAAGAASTAPRDLQIGDATLQIQALDKSAQDVVGVESTIAQQYEKKLPSGGNQSSGNRNQGVEKGRVVPKGL
ncbi:MAG TPA: hypothetical protein VKC51_10155 [Lacunisphaera sp.]|nr:hypothetical protein [Lacunisphaera sp.]